MERPPTASSFKEFYRQRLNAQLDNEDELQTRQTGPKLMNQKTGKQFLRSQSTPCETEDPIVNETKENELEESELNEKEPKEKELKEKVENSSNERKIRTGKSLDGNNPGRKVTFVEEFKPSLVRAKIQNSSVNEMKIKELKKLEDEQPKEEKEEEKKEDKIPENDILPEKNPKKNQAELGIFTAMKVAKWMRMAYGTGHEE